MSAANNVEEELHHMLLSQSEQDSEPEPRRFRCSPEENVIQLPVHKCGLDKRQFVDVSVANTLYALLELLILQFLQLYSPFCVILCTLSYNT